MKKAGAILILLGLLASAGCATTASNRLVGKWSVPGFTRSDAAAPTGTGLALTWEFQSDGTVVMQSPGVSQGGRNGSMPATQASSATGKYALADDKLTITRDGRDTVYGLKWLSDDAIELELSTSFGGDRPRMVATRQH